MRPPAQVAPLLHGAFTDRALLRELARRCEVVTFDWENVSVASLRACDARTARASARPSRALATGQDRLAEKRLFERLRHPDHALARGGLACAAARAPSRRSACPACSRRAASVTTARARR